VAFLHRFLKSCNILYFTKANGFQVWVLFLLFSGWGRDSMGSLQGHRRNNDSHSIEAVGAKLREMMPWIAKNELVDKARN
jgi:hypothetical protein